MYIYMYMYHPSPPITIHGPQPGIPTCTAKLWITNTARLKHSRYCAGSP